MSVSNDFFINKIKKAECYVVSNASGIIESISLVSCINASDLPPEWSISKTTMDKALLVVGREFASRPSNRQL